MTLRRKLGVLALTTACVMWLMALALFLSVYS